MLRILNLICLCAVLSSCSQNSNNLMNINNVRQIVINVQNKTYVFNRQDDNMFRFTYQEYPPDSPLAIPFIIERLSLQRESSIESVLWADFKVLMKLEEKPIYDPQIADWSLKENHIGILLNQNKNSRVYFRGSSPCTKHIFNRIIKKVESMKSMSD